MIIGVPKEIKNNENRVGLTEAGIRQLTSEGHKVYVQTQAGAGSQILDKAYKESGAEILPSAQEVYSKSDMIIKVKEPIESEYGLLKEKQILYTFLHLAAEPELTQVLCDKKIKAVAYETIQEENGNLPLLTPMSEVAGRMATQVGARYLQKDRGGKGILLGGVTGTHKAKVTIIGGGVVGINSAKIAVGMGADVTVLDVSRSRMEYLDHVFQGTLKTLHSDVKNIEEQVKDADLLIGAVLVAGSKAPQLVTAEMIGRMSPGSVVVDVAVDQGGCIETCRPTTHTNPTYEINRVVHYCVTNMPGVVARTSTYALTNSTLKYASKLAEIGLEEAMLRDSTLKTGLNTYNGFVCYEPVARDLNLEYKPALVI